MWGVMSCLRLGHRRKARRMKEEVGRKKEEQGNTIQQLRPRVLQNERGC
jgi:hypothetical protein